MSEIPEERWCKCGDLEMVHLDGGKCEAFEWGHSKQYCPCERFEEDVEVPVDYAVEKPGQYTEQRVKQALQADDWLTKRVLQIISERLGITGGKLTYFQSVSFTATQIRADYYYEDERRDRYHDEGDRDDAMPLEWLWTWEQVRPVLMQAHQEQVERKRQEQEARLLRGVKKL